MIFFTTEQDSYTIMNTVTFTKCNLKEILIFLKKQRKIIEKISIREVFDHLSSVSDIFGISKKCKPLQMYFENCDFSEYQKFSKKEQKELDNLTEHFMSYCLFYDNSNEDNSFEELDLKMLQVEKIFKKIVLPIKNRTFNNYFQGSKRFFNYSKEYASILPTSKAKRKHLYKQIFFSKDQNEIYKKMPKEKKITIFKDIIFNKSIKLSEVILILKKVFRNYSNIRDIAFAKEISFTEEDLKQFIDFVNDSKYKIRLVIFFQNTKESQRIFSLLTTSKAIIKT